MSSDAAARAQDRAHIAVVDVDDSTAEECSERELTSDSGLETKSSELTESRTLSDSADSLIKLKENVVQSETQVFRDDVVETGTSSLPYSTASSPGADTSENVSNLDELSVSQLIEATSNNSNEDLISVTKTHLQPQNMSSLEMKTAPHDNNTRVSDSSDSVDNPRANKSFDTNKSLTTSSVSLNDATDTNVAICKSPYSRSAENISVDIKPEQTRVDSDAILSQFKSHKNKVSATQVITPDAQTNTNLDVRYTRLPKELLSQDLGSIVKNVHGIFSSVSGSLKSAYTHRAGQIPYMKSVKPMPNGKLMNDIFEDEQHEDKVVNGLEKPEPEPAVSEAVSFGETLNHNPSFEEGDVKGDMLKLQVESLERVLAEQRRENMALRDRVKQQADELLERDHTFKDLETKMDLMAKRVEHAEREKDAAVMRYAGVERGAIEARRAAADAAARGAAAAAEAELAGAKLRAAREDKQRICQLYDDKCHELQNSERELSKVREDMKELEGRLKWTQSKLRMEADAYKDSTERAEKLQARVAELEAAGVSAEEAQRARQREIELKESQAALILCRHSADSLEKRLASCSQQLETTRQERDLAERQLREARAEVERLQAQARRLQEEAAELAPLRAQAALAAALGAQLDRETERAAAAEEALGRERARADTCARREAAALAHAASLTAQHVRQHAHTQHDADQAAALSADNAALRERGAALAAQVEELRAARAAEAERRHRENRVLARKVAELQEELAELGKRLEWEQGENGVLKKKHASALKELNRELARAQKRAQQLEAAPPAARAGSVTSLSSASGESAAPEERADGRDALPDIQAREPDRQALVERIVSLQRAAARRSERCSFLEEHCRQLTHELRGKSRLLRHLLPALPAQALASTASDSNKKEMAKLGGGAMAALWGGDAGGLTPELSLEMNRRLQTVLEDTLLKNITLKENMDTLGEEIARLKGHKCQDDSK